MIIPIQIKTTDIRWLLLTKLTSKIPPDEFLGEFPPVKSPPSPDEFPPRRFPLGEFPTDESPHPIFFQISNRIMIENVIIFQKNK